jgi:nucleoside-diphosphate-sugar epimerase
MKVFVTGATGAIGIPAVRALIAAGHEVSALARSDEKAGRLAISGARPVRVSLFDRDGLTVAFAGHDAVVNLATAIPSTVKFGLARSWRANARIRTEGSTAVVDAALAAGVGRVVQESIAMVYPDRGAEWIDEDMPIAVFPITTSTPVAEGNAQRFTDAGRVGVVLRFGLFYGPTSAQSREMVSYARRHLGVQLGRADGYWSSIHIEDAASAVVAALAAPAGIYNVVDDEPVTKRAYGDALSAAVGKRAWLRAPGRLTLLAGENMSSVNRSLRVSNRRFREATGWAPRYPSVREGWAATVAALRSSGRGNGGAARAVAGLLALAALFTGGWAQLAPHSFYTTFPGLGMHWVSSAPPYNEHLVRDTGGLYIALGVLAVSATIVASRALFVALGVAQVLEAVPHLAFHLGHADEASTATAVGTNIAIGAQAVLAIVLLAQSRGRPSSRSATSESST